MNQVDILRKMTGEERLEQAFKLSELTRELATLNIKEQLGKRATKRRVRQELLKRLRSG
ncbi:hypothetical protein HY407_01830 [Candidatus Gottesmanbacteria bacterium]|nr:hypothetical protein [Candidatus Gottesmanbacteria bacterium]